MGQLRIRKLREQRGYLDHGYQSVSRGAAGESGGRDVLIPRLAIPADANNGTLFYDMDAGTRSTITNFNGVASSLTGKFLRIAARYQSDLVAVRIWTSSSFNTVWLSPEGHVRHVLISSSALVVDNEDGQPVTVDVNGSISFSTARPQIRRWTLRRFCTGVACLNDLVRGFKVHITANPLQSPLVAQTVDIEIARFEGAISSPQPRRTSPTHANFVTAGDNYTKQMIYISNQTTNGNYLLSGAKITGYKWWNFSFPTLVDSNATAGDNPIRTSSRTGGSATFGCTVGAVPVFGATFATWNDPANPAGWAAPWTILEPAPVPWPAWPQAGLPTAVAPAAVSPSRRLCTNHILVDASSVLGSAVLVYQVDRTSGIITISPVNLGDESRIEYGANRYHCTPVKVFGVPQSDGSIKAYVFFYFTGTMPAS